MTKCSDINKTALADGETAQRACIKKILCGRIRPKIVQERLDHSSIAITLDTYSHVPPWLQEAAAKRFDEAFTTTYNESVPVSVR